MFHKQLLIITALIFSTAKVVNASDFTTTLDTTYTLTDTSAVEVTQLLTITNNTAVLFPTSFELTIPGNIHSAIQISDNPGKLAQFETQKTDRFTKINILFTNPVVGVGKIQTFTIKYQNPSILFGNQLLPQFLLPGIPNLDTAITSSTTLILPSNRCASPTTYPPVTTKTDNAGLLALSFSNNLPGQSIFVRCADKRYLSVTLHYYLTNTNMTPIETQITLPPDTNYQHFYYDQISPSPLAITTDSDGNVIASFRLEPKESKPITVTANAVISATPLHSISSPHPIYLSPKTYWPSSNSEIKNLAKELPDAHSIYRYLITSTTLDPTSSTKRLGGMMLVNKPASLQPIDLIDSFITVTRANNIMSRRLIGFSQSPDNSLWPTTLLENTLHLWTEYYDNATNQWIQVDPLWEKTSMANFFPIRDINHIVLAINGADDTIPYPVGYYQSPNSDGPDIQITDTEAFAVPALTITGSIHESLFHVLGITKQAQLILENKSMFSLYDTSALLTLDGKTPETLFLHRLPLRGQAIIPITLPKNYEQATLTLGDTNIDLTISKSNFAKPLILAPILAGISGILAVITRRLLVSRRK